MYVLPIIFLLVALLFFIIFHFKKRSIIKRILCMTCEEKTDLLNTLVNPFGYLYVPCQDIFSSTIDAWQRKFGFMNAYNIAAPYLNMTYDYQTVYFNYDNRTWLIEFWKGQYGINTGCEVGLYNAERIISPSQYNQIRFNAVSNKDMMPLSIKLEKGPYLLSKLSQVHWWLTSFNLGMFSKPKDLTMQVSITFPNCTMLRSFNKALEEALPDSCINVCNTTVSFTFSRCNNRYSLWQRIVRRLALFWTHIFCRLFRFITRPFETSGDRVLYLYYYLPFAFRKTLRLHRFKKRS